MYIYIHFLNAPYIHVEGAVCVDACCICIRILLAYVYINMHSSVYMHLYSGVMTNYPAVLWTRDDGTCGAYMHTHAFTHTHTHTHTHIRTDVYVYVCMLSCVCVCVCVCRRDDLLPSHLVAKRPRSHKPPLYLLVTLPNTPPDTRWWHVRTSLRPTHSPVVPCVWVCRCVCPRARTCVGVCLCARARVEYIVHIG